LKVQNVLIYNANKNSQILLLSIIELQKAS